MPIYLCYRGDCDNLAFEDAGDAVFILEDALGRKWKCLDSGRSKFPEFPDEALLGMMRAQRKAHLLGLSRDGTQLITRDMPDVESLRRSLIDQTSSLRPAGQEKRPMDLTLEPTPVPLRRDESGVYRVGASRVVLDIVIREFDLGASPEAIAAIYDTLDPADIYAVIAYYMRHRDEVDRYVRARSEAAEELRQVIEAKQGGGDLRASLLSRLAARKQEHAATSGR